MRVRRSFIVKVSIVFIIIVISVYALDYFKEKADVFDTPEEHFPNLYNASRYFFRVGYPDNWDHEAGAYGFLLNDTNGHVLNLFPLIESVTATQAPTAKPGTTSLPELMERDDTCIVSFYYREIDKEESNLDINDVMDLAIEELLNSDKGITEEDISSISEVTTQRGITFKTITFTYKPGSFPVKGEMYVTIRSMAYYIISFEAENDILGGSSYNKYRSTFVEILEDFRLSVFDH